jgi:hypothetical protein
MPAKSRSQGDAPNDRPRPPASNDTNDATWSRETDQAQPRISHAAMSQADGEP